MAIIVQDCWRACGRRGEQDAVRWLLRRTSVRSVELGKDREAATFCGISSCVLPRSLKLAPKRYVDNAKGMFLPHSPQAQEVAMRTYAAALLQLPAAVCCQGCKEELELAGIDMRHLAALLFASETGQAA